ncbi:hypothetical protein BGZ74_006044, partial [Mortierella antarctica]
RIQLRNPDVHLRYWLRSGSDSYPHSRSCPCILRLFGRYGPSGGIERDGRKVWLEDARVPVLWSWRATDLYDSLGRLCHCPDNAEAWFKL